MSKTKDPIIAEIVSRSGSGHRIAETLGITRQAFSQWRRVPSSRVLDVELATGIHRSRLRPDRYPPTNR